MAEGERPNKKTLERLLKEKEYLEQALSRKVIKTSEACKSLVQYIKDTPEPFDDPSKSNNPYAANLTCFVEGTLVSLVNGRQKPIEDLMVGDQVLTYNLDESKTEAGHICAMPESDASHVACLSFEDGTQITSTLNHPYYVQGKGWCSVQPEQIQIYYNVKVKPLTVGDSCYSQTQKSWIKLVDISPQDAPMVRVLTLVVEPNHNFFANTILVHNKCCSIL